MMLYNQKEDQDMDRIFIRDLEIHCIIGTKPVERTNRQKVVINVVLYCDFSRAAQSDRIEDTVNYKKLKDDIVAMVERSEFFLLERLVDEIAGICMKEDLVSRVRVAADKPGALTGARTVGVEIERMRQAPA